MMNPTENGGTQEGRDLENMEQYRDEHGDEAMPDSMEHFGIESESPRRLPSKKQSKRRTMFSCVAIVIVLLMVVLYTKNDNEESNPPEKSSTTKDSQSGEQHTTPSTHSTTPEVPPVTTTTEAPTRVQGCIFLDRFDNEHNNQHNKLYPGQFICSKNSTNHKEEDQRYRFGLTLHGDLVLQDTLASETYPYDKVLYLNPTSAVDDQYYFSLGIDGTFVINDGAWELPPNRKMHLTEQCLKEHDCPYLHLHADGVLVINYMDKHQKWQAKNALRVYGFG